MLISRDLKHQAKQRLQMIVSAIEMDRKKDAVVHCLELSQLLDEHTESSAEEKARKQREGH